MDEKDWIAIKVLYEERNISKASERLYVSQPALTYRLKNLEEDFGAKIVFKRKGGIEFTPAGKLLVDYAVKMIDQLQKTKEEIFKLSKQDEVTGTLLIGVSSNFAEFRLPKLLKTFSAKFPNVQFQINTGWSADIIDLLKSSSVHLAILRGNYDWEGVKVLLNTERLCLISKQEIDLTKLHELRFINYKTDQSLQMLISGWWNDRYSNPPIVMIETDKQETCKEMVKNDLGIAILPEICLHPSDDLQTYGLSYKNGEPVLRKTWLMYKQDSLEILNVKCFIDFITSQTNL